MNDDDIKFCKKLGRNIAEHRKVNDMTQLELAEYLGISQQHLASFERGVRKIYAYQLPPLAKLFGKTIDELLGFDMSNKKLSGPVPKLQKQLEQLQALPKAKQKFVSDMLDTVIQQQNKSD